MISTPAISKITVLHKGIVIKYWTKSEITTHAVFVIPKQTIILTLIGSLQPTKNTVTKVNTILTIKTKMKQITNYLLIK